MPDFDSATSSSGADSIGAAEVSADLDALDLEGGSGDNAETEAPLAEKEETAGSTFEQELDAIDVEPPVEEAEEVPAAEEPPAEEAKDPNAEELPEGVSVRDRNGRKEWVWPEQRGKAIYAGYKNAQVAEGILGEELTPEAIEARHNAYIDQEAMISDYLSGEPGAEQRFLGQLANWAKVARDNGEVQHNPLRNLANKLPQFLISSGDTETYEALAAPVFRYQLDQLYTEALAPGNEDLLVSLQRIDNRLFGSYKKREELSAPDPLAQREAALRTREDKIKQADQQRQKAEYSAWQDTAIEKLRDGVSAGIIDRLGADVLKSYEKFPTELQGVKDLLRNEFHAAMKKDVAWQQYLTNQTRKAANATARPVRDAITADLETRAKAKAIYWADPVRNPKVREILSQRAAAIKATSDARHNRHAIGAARREPGAVGMPVKQALRDKPNGGNTKDAWAAALDAAL